MTNSNSKRLRLTYGAVTLGLVAAIGLACVPTSRAHAQISGARDCSPNSIDNKPLNGGCGALTPSEFIADVRGNDPSDLQTIYADARVGGLVSSKYDRFASQARMGTAFKDGRVVVDGKTVMTDASSIGRTSFPGQTAQINIGGRTYFQGSNSATFQVNSISALVLFDDAGVVEFAVLTPCGNPIIAKKVIPEKKVEKEKEVVIEKIVKEEKKEVKKEVAPPALPKAGPEGAVGVFAGTSALGTIAHSLYVRYRRRNKD